MREPAEHPPPAMPAADAANGPNVPATASDSAARSYRAAADAPETLRGYESMQNRGGLGLARVRRGPADGSRMGQRRCGG